MNKTAVIDSLKELRESRQSWWDARTRFFSAYERMLTRLVYEGLTNYMSPNEIADHLGVGVKTIRTKMRNLGLDPRQGQRALNKVSSQALIENANLLGIEPGDLDLTSPLAYLPGGADLQRAYQERTVSKVTEIPVSNGQVVTGYLSAAEAVHDLHLRGGRLRYVCPVCGLTGDEVSGNGA